MSLSRPVATITLNGQRFSSAEAGLNSLRLDLGFNTHDRVLLSLWPDSELASAEPDTELQIGLSTTADSTALPSSIPGSTNDSDTVWSGRVEAVQRCAGAVQISGLASTAILSRVRRSATWSEQTVADIVRDLVGDLDSEIEADLDLPNYSIDNRRSIWRHLHELARLSGAELSCAADGGVRFILASRENATQELFYGIDLIDWQLTRRQSPVPAGAVEHAAASSAGSDKWHWLAHDPAAGNDQTVSTPAAFRTRAAADQYSQAVEQRAARAALRGSVWLGGRPDLRPGTLIELKQLPEGDSGPLRIRSVTHQLDGESGFITALAVEGSGATGGLF